jgi:hypothetical protein
MSHFEDLEIGLVVCLLLFVNGVIAIVRSLILLRSSLFNLKASIAEAMGRELTRLKRKGKNS